MERDRKLSILVTGRQAPESDWLDAALTALGHRVRRRARPDERVDVLLAHGPRALREQELDARRARGAVTILRAYGDPDRLDEHRAVAPRFDFTLTCGLADVVALYAAVGARALPLLPAAPPGFVRARRRRPRDIDIVFAGRLDGALRRQRLELLQRAAKRWTIAVATDGSEYTASVPLAGSRQLLALHQRAKLSLHWDRIALNRYGVTRHAPGTRAFAGPAAGCVLLVQLAPWLTQCYDVTQEVAGFADVEHALEVTADLLAHPDRLESIAAAARARCLAAHTYAHRAADVASLAGGQIPLHVRVLALGPWYQRIELRDGVATSLLTQSNEARWARLAALFPDVRGRRVVDLGANAGFFSMKCLERGAQRVVAVDTSPLACAQARFVLEVLGVKGVDVVEGDAASVPDERFHLWLLLALLHHHADVEPLLRTAAKHRPDLLLEWHVRERPYHHPVEKVVALLRRLGYAAALLDGGARPIVLARHGYGRRTAV